MKTIKKGRLMGTYQGRNIWVGAGQPKLGRLELTAQGGLVVVERTEGRKPVRYSVRVGSVVELPLEIDGHQYAKYKVV